MTFPASWVFTTRYYDLKPTGRRRHRIATLNVKGIGQQTYVILQIEMAGKEWQGHIANIPKSAPPDAVAVRFFRDANPDDILPIEEAPPS